jgi:acyl dehydratase
VSDWITIDQNRIDEFADVTEDRQFIHVDPNAAKETMFGGTVAHGFLSLSLLSRMAFDVMLVPDNLKMAVNYGFDRVRFLAPVPVGARIRGMFTLTNVEEKSLGQLLVHHNVMVDIDITEKPALTADWISLLVL